MLGPLRAGVLDGVRAVHHHGDGAGVAVWIVRRRGAGADRDDGHRAAGAGDVLHAADSGDCGDRHRDRDGNFLGRHTGLPVAHSRHAGICRIHRRSVRDDEERSGRARARRGARVLRDRRTVRHRRADCCRTRAGGHRAALQLVRILLARAARPDMRSVHYIGPSAEGIDHAFPRSAGRVRGPGQSGRAPALHPRQQRDDGRHRHDPDDDRHVCRVGDPSVCSRHAARPQS